MRALDELRGRDLVCFWAPLPCHGDLNVAAGSEIWVIDHFLILIAVSLLLATLFGLGRSFTSGAAHARARFAWTVSIVGVAFALALMVTEATGVAGVADQWATATGTEQDMALGAGTALF